MQIEIISPAPVLNTPDFAHAFGGKDGREIPKNERGLPHYFEFVALPGMRFEVQEMVSTHIARIFAPTYSSDALYLDIRFSCPKEGAPQRVESPSLAHIAQYMKGLLGTPYVWGGNWSAGIPQLLDYYPPSGAIDDETKILWTLKGVDCSGMLFEAAGGLTVRNTSQLISFGSPVFISGLSARQILDRLVPMDLVVWPGHVWYVLDREHSIESRFRVGVVQRPLLERLFETMKERNGVDSWVPGQHFVIRRLESFRSRL
jgi:hypothetical protein